MVINSVPKHFCNMLSTCFTQINDLYSVFSLFYGVELVCFKSGSADKRVQVPNCLLNEGVGSVHSVVPMWMIYGFVSGLLGFEIVQLLFGVVAT